MKSASDILLLALIAFYFVVLFKSARGGSMRIRSKQKDDKPQDRKDVQSDDKRDDNRN